MAEDKEEEKINQFIPEITLEITRSALIAVTVTNINDYWKHNSFDLPIRPCLRLFYGFNQLNNQILRLTKRIEAGRITHDAKFYLKPPLFLCAYELSLCVSAMNSVNNEWMNKSQTYTIDIPSIWSLNEYKLNDKVVFKAEKEVIVRDAIITEILPDNKYKLKYKENNNMSSKEIETECDVSRIYSEAPNIRFTIYLTNNCDVIKYLLVKRNDSQSIDTYNAMKHGLSESSTLIHEAILMYGFDFMVHIEPITDFISYNVIGYLFEPLFNHTIHCLFDVNHNEVLRFVNEMQYFREIVFEMGMSVEQMSDLNCSCDLCRTEISEWSFMFCDQTCIEEAHHFCTNCILSTIVLNKELKTVLYDVLKCELNIDCIDEIVNCLIGNVVYSDLQAKKETTFMDIHVDMDMELDIELRKNKRGIDDVNTLMPNAKRRKLNV